MLQAAGGRVRFGDVLRACTYGSTGHVGSAFDLHEINEVIDRNEPMLREFTGLVIAANFSGDVESLKADHASLWRSRFPDVVLLDSPANRGHSIGTSDLDNLLFDYCKSSGRDLLCKSAHDIIIDEAAFDILIEPAQFYFINAVSYDSLAAHGFDRARFDGEFLYPQTTFYVIDTRATDYLVDPELLDRTWAYVNSVPDYNGRVWEYDSGWTCERLLRDAVTRNELTTCSLTTDAQWQEILQFVIDARVTDCSFKGLAINGILHAQPGHPLIATFGT